MAQFVSHFAEPGDPKYAPPKPEVETPVCFRLNLSLCYARVSDINIVFYVLFYLDNQAQKRERIHKSRLEKGVEKAAEDLQKCKLRIFVII